MSDIRLNQRNVGKILTGEVGGLREELRGRGRRIAASAGPEFEMQEHVGINRFRVTVRSRKPMPYKRLEILRRAFGAGR